MKTSYAIESLFRDHLFEGEHIVWVGAPEDGTKDRRYRLTLIWVAIWLVLLCFMSAHSLVPMALSMFPNPAVIFMIAIPSIMLGGGVYMLRSVWKNYNRPQHYNYAVTNTRLLLIDDQSPNAVKAKYINTISQLSRDRVGRGDLIFTDEGAQPTAGTTIYYTVPLFDRFLNIENPEHVHRLVHEIMTQKEAAE